LRELRRSDLVKPKEEQGLARRLEDFLDKGAGSCILRQPRFADIVASALKQFDGTRYRMFAWCVMPNHVHVVFQPLGGFDLAGILHAWKSFTGVEINRHLLRSGALWQKEYYDHLIRSGKAAAEGYSLYRRKPEESWDERMAVCLCLGGGFWRAGSMPALPRPFRPTTQ